MQVLAIDPGYSRMGLAIGNDTGKLIKYDLIETDRRLLFEKRLWIVFQAIDQVITSNQINLIVYEEPGKLFGKNSLLVPQVIGCINLLVAKYDVRCIKYSPLEIKNITTGKGNADKTLVEQKALHHFGIDQKKFKLDFGDAKDDVADAIAVYMCYLSKINVLVAA